MGIDDLNINRQLIDRCKNGDAAAQFLLYKKFSKAMYNIAIRFLNNKMDAEDILQESFITAFLKLDTLTSYDAFGSWLKRIVINNCITHLHRYKFEFDDIDDSVSSDYPDNSDESFNIDPEIVHEAIKHLPPGGRTIVALHALEGYKHREIAELLAISESTSKTQYKRALDILFKNLKEKIYVS
jgi:RNA polymerase sigma-70 factor (ECF subfamily)